MADKKEQLLRQAEAAEKLDRAAPNAGQRAQHMSHARDLRRQAARSDADTPFAARLDEVAAKVGRMTGRMDAMEARRADADLRRLEQKEGTIGLSPAEKLKLEKARDRNMGPGKSDASPYPSDKEAPGGYNPTSVNKAIASSKQKIGGREAKAIHALLKGRGDRADALQFSPGTDPKLKQEYEQAYRVNGQAHKAFLAHDTPANRAAWDKSIKDLDRANAKIEKQTGKKGWG
jgi:hypothetical protein